MATMKGIVFKEKGKAVLHHDLERPVCGKDQILIRTLWSGITNGTERNCLMGGNYCPGFPNRAGYQIVGEIVDKGAMVENYGIGDLVYCGYFLGHMGYVAVPVGGNNLVVKLEPGIIPEEAALFGVASVAMHDCRKARVTIGQTVLVMGLGVIGQFTVQHSLAMGADVTAFDPDPDRLRIACKFGCGNRINYAAEGGWGAYDVVFEDSGADNLAQLVKLIRHGGTLVLVAGRIEVVYPFGDACHGEISLLHVNHFTKDDIHQVMRLVQKGIVHVRPLIKDIFKVDEAERVYGILRDDPARLFGTVFDWR